jgi:hypothetical protein
MEVSSRVSAREPGAKKRTRRQVRSTEDLRNPAFSALARAIGFNFLEKNQMVQPGLEIESWVNPKR